MPVMRPFAMRTVAGRTPSGSTTRSLRIKSCDMNYRLDPAERGKTNIAGSEAQPQHHAFLAR
jgi:hypothetical protein